MAKLASLTPQAGKVGKVELLGRAGALSCSQDAGGMTVQLGAMAVGAFPVTLKITGLH